MGYLTFIPAWFAFHVLLSVVCALLLRPGAVENRGLQFGLFCAIGLLFMLGAVVIAAISMALNFNTGVMIATWAMPLLAIACIVRIVMQANSKKPTGSVEQ